MPPRVTSRCMRAMRCIQESVRAFYTGWYTELVTDLPKTDNGMITVSETPGLGVELLPGLEKRSDALVKFSRATSH